MLTITHPCAPSVVQCQLQHPVSASSMFSLQYVQLPWSARRRRCACVHAARCCCACFHVFLIDAHTPLCQQRLYLPCAMCPRLLYAASRYLPCSTFHQSGRCSIHHCSPSVHSVSSIPACSPVMACPDVSVQYSISYGCERRRRVDSRGWSSVHMVGSASPCILVCLLLPTTLHPGQHRVLLMYPTEAN